MLNEKKIKIMMDLSRYENKIGKEELKIVRFYRSDYLGFALFRNFFMITLGYLIILALAVLYHLEYLLDNVHTLNLVRMGVMAIAGYVVLMAFYSIVTYVVYSIKYKRGRRSVHLYDKKLAELLALYAKDESANQ